MKVTLEKLIEQIKRYNPDEVEIITKAYKYAEELHRGQKRNSGEDYIIHPLNVAYTLAELHADRDTVCAGLLHDTLEDTNATKNEITYEFNETIAKLVDGVTKLKLNKMDYKTTAQDLYMVNMRKTLMGASEDVRIIIIKLADRLHNMRTLEFKSPEKQKRIALETLEFYAPLANFLGIYRMKSELEDISFSYLKPDMYKYITNQTNKIEEKNKPYIEEMLLNIKRLLNDELIPNEIKIRTKNIYGIYKRYNEGQEFKNMHDLIALKVMVDDLVNCYNALRIVHSNYKHINDHFKDYLFNPKSNLYHSIHTTVFAPNNSLVQTQIRTFDMDKVASFGLPSFWDINKGEAGNVMHEELSKKYQLISTLNEIDSMFLDNAQFVNEVKNNLFSDNICVYTADGKRMNLVKGSTPVDFAYYIHTDIGNQMVEAYVNGELVPFDYELKYSDRVVIVTSDLSEGPKIEWLNLAHTGLARKKIKEFMKKKIKEKNGSQNKA